MPPNRITYPLSAAAIEFAHDKGIAITWPRIEPVRPGTCLNRNLLRSAERQPYQVCFGVELYPTLEEKAAYLFYHLTTSHIFENGNKRTAVLCLDAFLVMNAHYLTFSNEQFRALAESVAASGENGETFQRVLGRLRSLIEANILPFSAFRLLDAQLYRSLHKRKRVFRQWKINKVEDLIRQR